MTVDAAGELLSQAQVIRNVVAEGVLADEVGIDFFGVGEHHREDFAVSAPGRRARGDRRADASASISARP